MITFRDWLQVLATDYATASPTTVAKLLDQFERINGAEEGDVVKQALKKASEAEARAINACYGRWKAESFGSRRFPWCPTKGGEDPLGLKVRRVYLMTDRFAIYSADDDKNDQDVCGLRYALLDPSYDECRELRTNLSRAAPDIAYITDAVCSMSPITGDKADFLAFRERIFEQLAQAMAAAFEGNAEQAQNILDEAKTTVESRRDSLNRMRYIAANTISAVLILTVGLLMHQSETPFFGELTFGQESLSTIMVLMAGALGAFFSVAIALRQVKVRRSITLSEMLYAGSARIPVGVIAAGAVVWLIEGGWILGAVSDEYRPASVLLFGFIAGFSEMFVPNALNQVKDRNQPEKPSPAKSE